MGHKLLAVFVVLLGAPLWGYTIVTKDGRKLQVEEAPTYEGGKANVMLAGGLGRIGLAEVEVDKAATLAANEGPRTGTTPFTNEDLAKAKGLSASGGEVTAEGKDAVIEPPRREASSSPSPGLRPAPPATSFDAESRMTEIQKRFDELNREIARRCKEWGFSNPSNDCDPQLYKDRDQLTAELQAATVERERARDAAHEGRMETSRSRDAEERRSIGTEGLEKRVEDLRKSLADAQDRLNRDHSTGADVNRKLQVAAELTRAEAELAAAREE